MRKEKNKKIISAAKAAFPKTLPIFAGFMFLGITYGIYMRTLGFSAIYPSMMSLFIFAGSLEFVIANLLLQPFNPLNVLLITLMVNARHIFYGISMLDKYRGMGAKKPYLIYGLCDETFSINYTMPVPKDIDHSWYYFFVTLFNQLYWFLGATIGGVFGGFIKFNTEGLDFVMTALFIVIFMSQWNNEENHESSLVGIFVSAICLIIFGKDNFIIASMIAMVAILSVFKKHFEGKVGLKNE